ncbi:hypothetical protein IX318_002030 [Porphyromonas levii]|nr:hypothetical protein [Porphyromonas levii]MBR8716146.1 hypothetical protein [Porphyromonas levii]MBR8728682.1 hypothetical protein [Porphyromonas levii]MBR8736996.1 hypothetical protein [Porphyromonas levii]MBR8774894.1 hypothetical protein [Porphyromonas levii]
MAYKKRPKYSPLVGETDLDALPLTFRFLQKKPTSCVGELYRGVQFSTSASLQTESLNCYRDFCPLSTMEFIVDELLERNINEK